MMKTTTFLKQAFLLGVVVCSSTLWGQLSITTANSPVTQNFDTLPSSGTSLAQSGGIFSAGWNFLEGGSNANAVYDAGTGSNSAGNTYDFGSASASDRSLGMLQSGSLTSVIGFKFKNNTGSTVTSITIGYTGETWRLASASDNLSVSYQSGNAALNAASGWTTVPGLQFTTPTTGAAAAVDGNNSTYRTVISPVTITGLSILNGATYTIRWVDSTGSSSAGMSIDDFSITLNVSTPIWDGSSWSPSSPNSSTDAIINGDYSGASFTAANLTVNTAKTLTITNGNTVTATNVTNNGSIVVENGGNFIQATGGTYAIGGNFTVNKNTTSAANKYVFWASPTASQNMFGIHTTAPQYVMTYNSDTDYYNTLTNPATSAAGVGYSVKMPTASATATFGGTSAQPNNGNVAVTLNNTSANKYNLIGNPYPSNVDLNAFYNANSSSLSSTFWFWDNTSNNVTTQTGNTTTNVGYATYNAAGSGTWTEAPSSLASHSGNAAAIGQGFIVEATGTTATFTNAMRISTTGNTFNKLNGNDAGKFWLKLATPYGSHTTLAVNYEGGALNGYDKYDSRAIGTGSDAFYSTLGAEKLVIQGKSPFTVDDVVPLGNKHFEAGNFVISLTQKEGVFNNGQAIYLHDKELGTYTNLQNGNYSFSSNAGEFANRFEIVYKLGTLATQETGKVTFEVYKDGEGFVARNNKNIETLEIFDASGRKVMELKPNAGSVKFKLGTKGMYILKARSAGKEYTKKLIK